MIMNRRIFLDSLTEMWTERESMDDDLTLEDLMEDCTSLGMSGAMEIYERLIDKRIEDCGDVA